MVTLLLISITRIYTQTVIISKPVLLNHSAHLYRKPLFFVIIAPFEGTHKVDVSSGENEFDTPALYEHMAFSHGLLKKKTKKTTFLGVGDPFKYAIELYFNFIVGWQLHLYVLYSIKENIILSLKVYENISASR